jgi:hypothetical protein
MRDGYLMTLQDIGDRLAAINKPLDAEQSRVIADVLAEVEKQEHAILDAYAVIENDRRTRPERRLQAVPVAVERRNGEDRRA